MLTNTLDPGGTLVMTPPMRVPASARPTVAKSTVGALNVGL